MKKDRNALEDLTGLIALLDDNVLDKLDPYSDVFREKVAEFRGYWGTPETREPWGVCVVLSRYSPEDDDERQVLIVHGPKGIGLPGGKPIKGETPLIAGLRELLEETGLRVPSDWLALGNENPIVADNGVPTYFLHQTVDLSATEDGFESDEGVSYWAPPRVLIGKHARFPNYNRAVLARMCLL